jgi:methylated-DNA-[protein]-cysteine S-methyltransferase
MPAPTSHPAVARRLHGMSTSHTVIDSPIGRLTLVADDGALIGLYMQRHRRRTALGDRVDAGFDDVISQLGEYFAGTRKAFDLVLRPDGDEFQHRVWDLLRTIPYGETRSYGQLARELGDPALAPAVGAANARNPLSILVPCHRVVGADGALVGYAGGLERKAFLLDLERMS